MAQDHAQRYIPSVGTQRTHISLYFAVIPIDAILVFGANRMRTIMLCIQATVKSPVSMQISEAISSRCISLQRKVNGNMDSAKYQSDIIHEIEILCECVVFPQKDIFFIQ